MSVVYSQAAITARLNGVITAIGNNANMLIRESGSTLSTIPLASPCGTAAGGVLVFTTPERDTAIASTGSADNALIQDSSGSTVVSGLTVGAPLSNADVIIANGLNSTLISSGQVLELISAQIIGA